MLQHVCRGGFHLASIGCVKNYTEMYRIAKSCLIGSVCCSLNANVNAMFHHTVVGSACVQRSMALLQRAAVLAPHHSNCIVQIRTSDS